MAVDPTNDATVYAGAGRLYRSTDSGQTWVALNSPSFPEFPLKYWIWMWIDPQNPNVLLLSCFGRVLRSDDAAATWYDIGAGLPHPTVWGMDVLENDHRTMYFATYGRGVFRTTVGGL